MDKKAVLVTGGAGFIGSNFIKYFLNKYNNYNLINLDALTEAADMAYLNDLNDNESYLFIKGNICDKELIQSLFKDHDIKGVIHFAAESHVDHSILRPELFIQTNIVGTFTLLDAARQHWMESPFLNKKGYEQSRFHHVSTDEVFGALGPDGYFNELTPYAPNSPYSASKASSDMLARSYHHTYGLNITISNCSNNYGKHQHNEKLIPTIIRNAILGNSIPIYGNGKNIRDWLYVDDHCKAIDLIYHNGKSGDSYIIGGDEEKNNLELAYIICDELDKICPKSSGNYKNQITFVTDRPGHDFRYAIDFSKIKKELNWQPSESFNSAIKKTILWYIKKYNNKY